MTIYDLKPKFQNFLRPIVIFLHKKKITPNQITIFTCVLSILVGLFLFNSDPKLFFIFPIFLFFRMALNAIDGMLAKEHQLKTNLGSILNEITDVIADGFLYFSFFKLYFINTILILVIIYFSAISELTGVSALLNNKERQYQGPMGKSDRAFFFSIMAILISLNITNQIFYFYYLLILLLLLLKTIFNRIKGGI